MDEQLSSILKYWYFPSKDPARQNCDRITTSTFLLFLTLWTISLTIHLLLGSVHARHWIRHSLLRWLPDHRLKSENISKYLKLTNNVNTLGTSGLQIAFSLATAAVLSRGESLENFNNALALWLLRPTASTLINIISLWVNKEVYSDAAAYASQGEFFLSLLSIWPFAYLAGATLYLNDNTGAFLTNFNISSSAIPLLRAGSAFGIMHWILFMYGVVCVDIGWFDFEVPYYPVLRPIVVALNFGRLFACFFLWLGALQVFGNPKICVFYLDPSMVKWILVLWTLEPIAEALWSGLSPSFVPYKWSSWRPILAGLRDWKEPTEGAGIQHFSTTR